MQAPIINLNEIHDIQAVNEKINTMTAFIELAIKLQPLKGQERKALLAQQTQLDQQLYKEISDISDKFQKDRSKDKNVSNAYCTSKGLSVLNLKKGDQPSIKVIAESILRDLENKLESLQQKEKVPGRGDTQVPLQAPKVESTQQQVEVVMPAEIQVPSGGSVQIPKTEEQTQNVAPIEVIKPAASEVTQEVVDDAKTKLINAFNGADKDLKMFEKSLNEALGGGEKDNKLKGLDTKTLFNDLTRLKGSKEKLTAVDITQRSWTAAIKDAVILIVQVILLPVAIARAFGVGDNYLVTNTASKQRGYNAVESFSKMVDKQKAAQAKETQQKK